MFTPEELDFIHWMTLHTPYTTIRLYDRDPADLRIIREKVEVAVMAAEEKR